MYQVNQSEPMAMPAPLYRSGSQSSTNNGSIVGSYGSNVSVGSPRKRASLPMKVVKPMKHVGEMPGGPKKGGAGGKTVWGQPGTELEFEDIVDIKDPNYEDEDDDSVEYQVTEPEISLDDMVEASEPYIAEYFENSDTQEVAHFVRNLNNEHAKSAVLVHAIIMAIDRHNAERELISRLLSDMLDVAVSQGHIEAAFDQLLNCIDDITIDAPQAPSLVAKFMARAVGDDCLPPRYVKKHKSEDSDLAKEVLRQACALLNMRHSLSRLEHIWGDGGGRSSVKKLTRQVIMMLKEFLISEDLKEAENCLRDLDVPHFHHEVVYEGIVIALEALGGSNQDNGNETASRMLRLFSCFYQSGLVTATQMRTGFERVKHDLSDLTLDLPNAKTDLDRLVETGIQNEYLPQHFRAHLRGRKRFLSEGDHF